MLPEQHRRIMGYFLEEARDHLTTIEQGLLNLQSTIEDPEMANQLWRSAHSIKAGAAMLGLSSIQQTAHRLEEGLQVFQVYPVKVDQKLEALFIRVFDSLRQLLEQLSSFFDLNREAVKQIMCYVEPAFEELNNHLRSLVEQLELISTNLAIRATTETERIYLYGNSTFQATDRALSQFRGAIARRNWQHDSNDKFCIEIDLRLPTLSRLEALRAEIESSGATIETVYIETIQTCRVCRYYYGQCDIICALHPYGPEEENCRDWQSRSKGLEEDF